MKNNRKFISLLLSLLMVLSMVPMGMTTAFAGLVSTALPEIKAEDFTIATGRRIKSIDSFKIPQQDIAYEDDEAAEEFAENFYDTLNEMFGTTADATQLVCLCLIQPDPEDLDYLVILRVVREEGDSAWAVDSTSVSGFDEEVEILNECLEEIPGLEVAFFGEATLLYPVKDITTETDCTVNIDKEFAEENDTVTVTVTGSNKAKVLTVKAGETTINATAGATSGVYTFTMPKADVTVCVTSSDEKQPVEYIDASGAKQTVTDYSIIDSTTTELTAGWWVVNGTVNISAGLTQTASSDVKIILTDGCMLNSSDSYTANSGNVTTFYGQENGTGTFTVCGADLEKGIIAENSGIKATTLMINGGKINTIGGSGDTGGAGLTCQDLIINGGILDVTGGECGSGKGGIGISITGTAKFNGGTLTATGGCTSISEAQAMQGVTPEYATALSAQSKSFIYAAKSMIVKVGTANPPTTVISHEDTTNLASSFTGKPFVTMTENVPTVTNPVKLVDNGTVTAEAQGIIEIDLDPYYADKTQAYFTTNFSSLFVDGNDQVVFTRLVENGYLRKYFGNSEVSYYFMIASELYNCKNTLHAFGKVVRVIEQPSKDNGYKFTVGYDKDNLLNGTAKLYKITNEPAQERTDYSKLGNDFIDNSSESTLTLITREATPRTFVIKPNDSLMLETAGLTGVEYDIYKIVPVEATVLESGNDYYYGLQVTLPLSGYTTTLKSDVFTAPAHTHTWSYSASGDTLTATCTATDCTVKTQSIKLVPSTCNYDGQAHGVTFDGSVDGVALTDVKYYDGTKELSGAPVKAGTYTAKLTKGTATAETTIVISQKPLTVAGTTVSDKTYDGTTTADVNPGSLQGVISGDDVKLDTVTGTFEDKNAADCKAVNVAYTLKGEDASNYTIEDASLTANIGFKEIQFTVRADEITKNSVKVSSVITDFDKPEFEDAQVLYAISTNANDPIPGWQESGVFTNLQPGTDYYIYLCVNSVENYSDHVGNEMKVTTLTPTNEELFEEYKAELIESLEDRLDEDIEDIIADAIDELENLEYASDKSLDENKQVAQDIFDGVDEALKKALNAVLEEYKRDAVTELDNEGEDIDNILADAKDTIAEVELGDDLDLDDAKNEIDEIVSKAKEDILTARKNVFEEYKQEKIEEIENSDDSEAKKEKNKEAVNSVEYDETKSLEENLNAIDSAINKKGASAETGLVVFLIGLVTFIVVVFVTFLVNYA